MTDELSVVVFRVVESDDTRIDLGPAGGDVMGWGVKLPCGRIYVDWNRKAYSPDDRLEHPHVSIYGSLDDVEQGTGGDVEELETIDVSRYTGPFPGISEGLAEAASEISFEVDVDKNLEWARCADDEEDDEAAYAVFESDAEAAPVELYDDAGDAVDEFLERESAGGNPTVRKVESPSFVDTIE